MGNKHTKASQSPSDGAGKKPVKAPFAYYGAKQRLARRIVRMLPPHNAWVEGFCGSAALTLAKPPALIEVINDRDGQIVNLFHQLRSNAEALCNTVSLTPYAYEEFKIAKARRGKGSRLEQARQFLVGTMMTINGTPDGNGNHAGFSFSQSYCREGKEARVNRWYNLPDRLASIVERLRNVRIEQRDARELVSMFSDRPATLMYLDPPYFTKRDHSYVIDANDEDFHKDLLSRCMKARCMILLSGYDNPLYQNLLVRRGKWKKLRIETQTRDTSGTDYARTEVLWMNQRFVSAKKLERVPIRLTKQEKLQNKVNPPRKY